MCGLFLHGLLFGLLLGRQIGGEAGLLVHLLHHLLFLLHGLLFMRGLLLHGLLFGLLLSGQFLGRFHDAVGHGRRKSRQARRSEEAERDRSGNQFAHGRLSLLDPSDGQELTDDLSCTDFRIRAVVPLAKAFSITELARSGNHENRKNLYFSVA